MGFEIGRKLLQKRESQADNKNNLFLNFAHKKVGKSQGHKTARIEDYS